MSCCERTLLSLLDVLKVSKMPDNKKQELEGRLQALYEEFKQHSELSGEDLFDMDTFFCESALPSLPDHYL